VLAWYRTVFGMVLAVKMATIALLGVMIAAKRYKIL